MALLRTILIALAVMLAPAANVAHAGVMDDGPHVVHGATTSAAMSAADLTDCCKADNLRTSVSCDTQSALVEATRSDRRPSFGKITVEASTAIPSGQGPSDTLDPPRF